MNTSTLFASASATYTVSVVAFTATPSKRGMPGGAFSSSSDSRLAPRRWTLPACSSYTSLLGSPLLVSSTATPVGASSSTSALISAPVLLNFARRSTTGPLLCTYRLSSESTAKPGAGPFEAGFSVLIKPPLHLFATAFV